MSRFRTYGQGNGPTRAKTLRQNRRLGEIVRTDDERDIGIRPGVGAKLGVEGDFEVTIDGLVIPRWQWLSALAHHWFTKGKAA